MPESIRENLHKGYQQYLIGLKELPYIPNYFCTIAHTGCLKKPAENSQFPNRVSLLKGDGIFAARFEVKLKATMRVDS